MNTNVLHIAKRSLSLGLAGIFLFSTIVVAQKPLIKSVDKVQGATAERVTVTGDNFGTDASQLVVFFGATKGVIESVSNQVLEVLVPSGATYDNISVTHLASGLSAYTRPQFLLSYGGTHPFSAATLQGQFDFNAESGLYDLCLCDFDGDNKTDVGTSNNKATSVRILRNTSTGPGNISFAAVTPTLPLNTRSLRIKCGDLNGDGKPDIVISEDGDGHRVFVFKNTSSGPGNFTFTGQSINIGKKTTSLELADLDLDGKPEIIVSNQGSNSVTILKNESSLAAVSINATPIFITIPGAATTDGLAVEDLNGDQLPEIVTAQYQTSSSNVFVIENKSVPGTLNLGPVSTLPLPASVKNIRIGDVDGDGKADIACSILLSSSIAVMLNNGSGGSIAFRSPASIPTVGIPVGLDLGDLDGDTKPDITVVSIGNKGISLLNNTSTPGTVSFVRTDVNTTYINRHVAIGDLDGDSKPDIAFTSIDDDNNSVVASKVSVLRNANCPIPELPAGPFAICSGAAPFRLTTRPNRGVTYEWRNESTNTVVATGTNPYYDVTVTGKYSVTAITEGNVCSNTSNTVDVTISPGTLTGIPVALNNGPLCAGNSLQLSINNVGATSYEWTGPNGYTGSGMMPAAIANFQPENVGRYYVDIKIGTCVAERVSTVVEAIDATSFGVTYAGSSVICQGNTKTLTVAPNPAGTTYQWYEKTGGIITGAVNPTFTVSTTGDYYVRATYPGCSAIDTESTKIIVATPPVVSFEMPSNACTGTLVQFNNTSVTDADATAQYLWTFGDGNTSTLEEPTHTFLSSATFNVNLKVSYSGGVCETEVTKPIVIQSAPIPTITNPDSEYTFCEGETLLLEVIGSYTSYKWSTGATTSSIQVTDGGTYSVEVMSSGCTLNASRTIVENAVSLVEVTATPPSVNEGGSSQLNVEGLLDYLWSPSETLSDAGIPNPVASPLATTTYEVVGTNASGCEARGSVQVIVIGDAIVTKLTPKNFFSPNDDMVNPYWQVENIESYPQCGVAIYDLKGVKVHEAKPYLNDWDGTYKGTVLPDGVYYFIIRCEGEEDVPKTGSITLLR